MNRHGGCYGINPGDVMECKRAAKKKDRKGKRINHEKRLDATKGESAGKLFWYLVYGAFPMFSDVSYPR